MIVGGIRTETCLRAASILCCTSRHDHSDTQLLVMTLQSRVFSSLKGRQDTEHWHGTIAVGKHWLPLSTRFSYWKRRSQDELRSVCLTELPFVASLDVGSRSVVGSRINGKSAGRKRVSPRVNLLMSIAVAIGREERRKDRTQDLRFHQVRWLSAMTRTSLATGWGGYLRCRYV